MCIPVYNGERYLAGTVYSVLDQTHRDFELVVLDNASTDATNRIARARACQSYPRFRCTVGPSASRRRGLISRQGTM